ncbi:hypothetical protein EJB05_05196 [Eragrostis curvula]|uniref:STI1/HOP DP domain-containing protein n=1 Tax=Eragrostis curvula TaxID=38414 RepID=A0A5J9WE53_9POAL|nr:hypothetical protein EJB05_05196 [Eragrostis curvula]
MSSTTHYSHLSSRPRCQPNPGGHPQNLGAEEAGALAPSAAMESAFDLNTRIFLSMSRQLPYGDKSPRMDFFEAAFNGDLGRLREMARGKDAEGKAQLAEACVGGQGPLQAAARLGRLDVLRCLVEELGFDVNGGSKDYGADVNSTDPDTPLVVATAHSLTDCIKYLLKAGGDPNIHSDIVSNWSVEGILAHVKAIHSKAKFEQSGKRTKAKLKKHINAEPKKPTQGEPKKPTQAEQKKPTQVEPKKPAQAEPKKPIQAEQKKPTQAELKNPAKAGLKLNGDEAVGRKDYLAASKLYSEAIDLDPNDATLYSNRSLCHLKIGEATKALFDANTCIKMQPEWLKGYYRKGAALMSLKEYKGACDAFMAGLKRDPNNGEMEKMFRQAVEAMKKEHAARKNLDSID